MIKLDVLVRIESTRFFSQRVRSTRASIGRFDALVSLPPITRSPVSMIGTDEKVSDSVKFGIVKTHGYIGQKFQLDSQLA
jgi:hypothetical protein